MKQSALIILSFFILATLLDASSSRKSKSKRASNTKSKEKSSLKSKEPKHRTSMESFEPESNPYVSEEYLNPKEPNPIQVKNGRDLIKVQRHGKYLIGIIPVPPKNKNAPKEPVEYLDPRAAYYDKRAERRKNKKSNSKKNSEFNIEVDSLSDASSVPDDCSRPRPTVIENNATYSDFVGNRNTKLVHHISNRVGDFEYPKFEDNSDILGHVVADANFYTHYHYEYDAFMTASKKEPNIHLWRNEKNHPMRTYVRENELDVTVPHYENYDPETVQTEMESHIGRRIGRDKKPKIFERRDTFSSINAGCLVM